MAFTEGFISELVGRRATINDLPIGKVTDFVVGKPDAVFPQIDGLVDQDGARASLRTDRDRRRRRSRRKRRADDGAEDPRLREQRGALSRRRSPRQADRRRRRPQGRSHQRHRGRQHRRPAARRRRRRRARRIAAPARRCDRSARRWLSRIGNVPRSMIAWDSVAPIREVESVAGPALGQGEPPRAAPSVGTCRDHRRSLVARSARGRRTARRRNRRRRVRASRRRDAQESHRRHRHGTRRRHHRGDGRRRRRRSARRASRRTAIAAARRNERLHRRRVARTRQVSRRYRRRPDDDRLRVDLSAPHDRGDDSQDSRNRARVGVHLLSVRARQRRISYSERSPCARCCSRCPTAFIDRIMETDLVTVEPQVRRPSTSRRRSRGTICLPCPCVDDDGKMLGIVTVDDAIDAIMPDDIAKKLPTACAPFAAHPRRDAGRDRRVQRGARANRRVGRRTQGARGAPCAGGRRRRAARRRAVASSGDRRFGTDSAERSPHRRSPARPVAHSAITAGSVELGWLSLFGTTPRRCGNSLASDGRRNWRRARSRRSRVARTQARLLGILVRWHVSRRGRRTRRSRRRAESHWLLHMSRWHSKVKVATKRAAGT